jgi:hypothetical protein
MQGSLFDTTPGPVNQYGRAIELNPTVDDRDRARLSRQCLALLARLRQGEATNAELSRIAMRFGARLEELRRAGFTIEAKRGDGGLFTYTLNGGK